MSVTFTEGCIWELADSIGYKVIPTCMEKSGTWTLGENFRNDDKKWEPNSSKYKDKISYEAHTYMIGFSKWYDDLLSRHIKNPNDYKGDLDYYVGFAVNTKLKVITLPIREGTFYGLDEDILVRSLSLLRSYARNSKNTIYIPMLSRYYSELSADTFKQMCTTFFYDLPNIVVVDCGDNCSKFNSI